jgi:rfaE bifunctional protein kinase chain/domain
MKGAVQPRLPLEQLTASMDRFRKLKVLVVGDLFLDEYLEGELYEISREGPIPVLRLESKRQTAGAAGNLASSIRNLGATVSVVGVVGKDAGGRVLLSQLRRKGILTRGVVIASGTRTFTYSKVRARVENTPSRELFRMDILPEAPLSPEREREIIRAVRAEARGAHAIIVLDQIHHLVSRGVLAALPRLAREAGALLHGSSRDNIGSFRGFDLITPNDREAAGAAGGAVPRDLQAIFRLGRALKEEGRHRQLLLTLGADGMALFPRRGSPGTVPSYARHVEDVTGAGDALSSVALLGNASGWDLATVAWMASQAAAIAVEHIGTHHVTLKELKKRVEEEANSPSRSTRARTKDAQ